MKPDEALLKAKEVILAGGIVIVPTETFYGIAANPFDEAAVLRIFEIKSRRHAKPLPLIASDLQAIRKLSPEPSPVARKLMDRFWPGSLTILMRTEIILSELLAGKAGKVGVRIPPDCPARSLAGMVGGLITATSANLSGDPNPSTVRMISPKVIDSVDFVVDMGATPGGKPSTVMDIDGEEIKILREGAISTEQIRTFMLQVNRLDTIVPSHYD